jgi:HNH endonuclease
MESKKGRPMTSLREDQIDEVLHLWDAGWATGRIAEELGSWSSTVKSIVINSGRTWVNRHQQERHYAWKGARHVDNQGYVVISLLPDDPFMPMARGRHRRVLEHRLVMAKHLGRLLMPTETVHHIDGDRANNSIENLQLRQGSHGAGILMMCNSCGSHDVSAAPLDLGVFMAENATSSFVKMGEEPLTSHLVNASANRGNTMPVARKGPSSDSEPGTMAVRGTGRMTSGEVNGPSFSPVTRISFPNSPEMSQTGRGLRTVPSKAGVSDFWQQRYDVGTVIA